MKKASLAALARRVCPDGRIPIDPAELALLAVERLETEAQHRRVAERALRDSEARYRQLLENSSEAVLVVDGASGRILTANAMAVQLLGDASRPLAGVDVTTLGRTAGVETPARDFRACLDEALRGRTVVFEWECDESSGAQITCEVRLLRLPGEGATTVRVSLTDITPHKLARRAAMQQSRRAEVMLRAIREAVVTTGANGEIDYLNPAAEQMLGWSARDARGRSADSVLTLISAKTGAPLMNPVARCIRSGRYVSAAARSLLVQPSGRTVTVEVKAAPIRDADGTIVSTVVILKDLSEEAGLREKLDYQATHDALTGLANRSVFERRLADALASTENRPAQQHAMLYLDLDQFKVINDTCGHDVGDALVRQVAGSLQQHVRASDVLARLGGDEFGVLLLGCPANRALRIAESLCAAVRELPFRWEDRVYQSTASIGVVLISADSVSAASIMSAADVACFAAKDRGRNRIHLYHEEDVPEHHQEMRWVARINRACEENRLVMFHQPIVPIGQNQDACCHYELLLRMTDRRGQIVPPEAFIPAAERYNLMPTIDRWVVRHALSELAHGGEHHDGSSLYMLSINLSGTSLSDDSFLEFVRSELEQRKLTPGAICFEITETAAIANIANVAHFMRELKKLGCLFSLDDFGSGLSSLTYLKELPVDFLKIDGHFVSNICDDPIDHAMVDAINQIGHAMGIKTVAERVESAAAVARLAAIGIDYAQGYYFARPDHVAGRDTFTGIDAPVIAATY